jgi:hypothetical protein
MSIPEFALNPIHQVSADTAKSCELEKKCCIKRVED